MSSPIPPQTAAEKQWLQQFLSSSDVLPRLSPDEEKNLSAQALAGNEKAVETLVRANQRFVAKVAQGYQGNGLGLSDLVSEGNIGLLQAARTYDATKGKTFVEYSVWLIRRAIEQSLGNEPPRTSASMDAPLRNGLKTTLHDVLGTDDKSNIDSLLPFLSILTEQEQTCIRHCYGIGTPRTTHRETAQLMGVSRQRIRKIVKNAQRKLWREYQQEQQKANTRHQ